MVFVIVLSYFSKRDTINRQIYNIFMHFRTFEPFIILIVKHYHTIKQSYYKILQTYCFHTKKLTQMNYL